jgi:hypothetical protein
VVDWFAIISENYMAIERVGPTATLLECSLAGISFATRR